MVDLSTSFVLYEYDDIRKKVFIDTLYKNNNNENMLFKKPLLVCVITVMYVHILMDMQIMTYSIFKLFKENTI